MASIKGTGKNDIRSGGSGADSIYGLAGNDTLYGNGGNDNLYGDAGTDSLFGGDGNDTLKGGTGIANLIGGGGNDTAFYDPTTSEITSVGEYLAPSIIDAETVRVFNKAAHQGQVAKTVIWYGEHDESADGHIVFSSQSYDTQINVGTIVGQRNIVVTGDGGLDFWGPDHATHIMSVTGTSAHDEFHGGYGSEILIGGGGDDTFVIKGGDDQIISNQDDADTFDFRPDVYGTNANITGFNGAGLVGGDTLYLTGAEAAGFSIVEHDGHTTFRITEDYGVLTQVTVDAVGLAAGTDYFFY